MQVSYDYAAAMEEGQGKTDEGFEERKQRLLTLSPRAGIN